MVTPKRANIQSFVSNSGNLYVTENSKLFSNTDLKKATLIYIYKSGSGFDYFKETSWPEAKKIVNSYKSSKDYVDFYIYYKYPGNTTKNYTCDELKEQYKNRTDLFSTNDNSGVIYYLNKVIDNLNNDGYKVHGYLQDMYPVRYQDKKTIRILPSNDEGRCDKNAFSNYKYYLINNYIKKQFKEINPKNITLVEDFKIIIDVDKVKNGEDAYLQSWKDKYTEWVTDDGRHLSSDKAHPVVQKYLQSLVDRNPNL